MLTKSIKSKQIVSTTEYSDQFKTITIRYKRIEYNTNVMRQCVCFVIKTVMGFLYNCMPIGRASDSMNGPHIKLLILAGCGGHFCSFPLIIRSSTDVFFRSGISILFLTP